jgi:hypothetical protein
MICPYLMQQMELVFLILLQLMQLMLQTNPCKGYDILSINFAKSDVNQFGSIVAEITDEANFVADTKTTIGAVVCKNEAPTHVKVEDSFL